MRKEIDQLKQHGYEFDDLWQIQDIFEEKLSAYTGAPYVAVVDSCTHAIELCFRYYQKHNMIKSITIPKYTYVSVPMNLYNIGLDWQWTDDNWVNWYKFGDNNIIDAAGMLTTDMYIPGNHMCLSFHIKKQLKIGQGGAVLSDNKDIVDWIKLVRHDGRDHSVQRWQDQNEYYESGFHYNLSMEDCALGIMLLDQFPKENPPIFKDSREGYTDLSKKIKFK